MLLVAVPLLVASPMLQRPYSRTNSDMNCSRINSERLGEARATSFRCVEVGGAPRNPTQDDAGTAPAPTRRAGAKTGDGGPTPVRGVRGRETTRKPPTAPQTASKAITCWGKTTQDDARYRYDEGWVGRPPVAYVV